MTNPAKPRAYDPASAALIDAAIGRLDAAPARAGWWSYTDENDVVCFVRTKELELLGTLMADPWTRRDAYDHWCVEVPTRKRLPSR
jgi:hypothetical protein